MQLGALSQDGSGLQTFCIKSIYKKKKKGCPENNFLKDLYEIEVNTGCDCN